MKIFDTHAHYDDEAFDKDRDELLTGLLAGNIGTIVNVGASMDGCRASVELASKYEHIYAAVGIHPDDYERLDKNQEFLDWLRNEALARETNLPVIIHSRDACADTIDILKSGHASEVGGIIHCYSYSKETVKTFYDMNFYFGIGGVLTFKNAKKLVEAADVIPLERIVLETDCPYLAPVPNRGKRNDSSNIQYVIEKLADIKGVTKEQIAEVTYQNACRVYGLHL